MISLNKKIGILGGGQLGKMLGIAAAPWHLPIYFLDKSSDFPAGKSGAGFEVGDFNKYNDVYDFGKKMDIISIEIEHVNTDALLQLKREGHEVHPDPEQLITIKDKGLQKTFFEVNDIPSSPFQLFDHGKYVIEALEKGILSFPFVQKARRDGYDGRGVAVIRSESDIEKILPVPCLVEELVPIEKELAVIVAKNKDGAIKAFPTVEMVFNPDANLVEFISCPASIDKVIDTKAQELAIKTIEAFGINGLLAVELFLTKSGEVLVNEVAPRTHNSGHHTIDNSETSQFEQQLRAISNLPLGSTKMNSPAVMLNLLGEPGYEGPAKYDGLEECLNMEGVHVHLYGKKMTKPFRKMGHVTVVDQNLEKAMEKAIIVKNRIKVIA